MGISGGFLWRGQRDVTLVSFAPRKILEIREFETFRAISCILIPVHFPSPKVDLWTSSRFRKRKGQRTQFKSLASWPLVKWKKHIPWHTPNKTIRETFSLESSPVNDPFERFAKVSARPKFHDWLIKINVIIRFLSRRNLHVYPAIGRPDSARQDVGKRRPWHGMGNKCPGKRDDFVRPSKTSGTEANCHESRSG